MSTDEKGGRLMPEQKVWVVSGLGTVLHRRAAHGTRTLCYRGNLSGPRARHEGEKLCSICESRQEAVGTCDACADGLKVPRSHHGLDCDRRTR